MIQKIVAALNRLTSAVEENTTELREINERANAPVDPTEITAKADEMLGQMLGHAGLHNLLRPAADPIEKPARQVERFGRDAPRDH